MSSQLSTEEGILLSRLANGDMQAFDELYWKYQKAVYQNVFKMVRDSVVAEDMVQEVFISLWEKRQIIDHSRAIGGWLFVSSYNRSINALKRKLKESQVYKQIDLFAEESGSEKETIEIQLNILEKAIAQLSPRQKKVFELCKLQGLSYEETAKQLGISKNTVKEHLAAALQNLREFARQNPASSLVIFGLIHGLYA